MSASALNLAPHYLQAQETLGGGSLASPATGPAPSYGLGGRGMTLVKNWNFGSTGVSTVRNMTDMTSHFFYHDQYGTIDNSTKYGSVTVAPNDGSALSGQPVEGINTAGAVRAFTSSTLRTFLTGLNGATTVNATTARPGNGSFMAKWELPNGGSLLNQDIVWETRVRYVTPPYFWFAIWNAGDLWNNGAEIDIVESFGYDNGGGYTNYEGDYWHSAVAGGTKTTNYSNWGTGMASRGITNFDATQYHIWTLVYRVNNTFSSYVDGIEVQSGTLNWTRGGIAGGIPIEMNFLFDAAWGHRHVSSVNKTMSASEFAGKYYEWDYSRIYLSPAGGGTDLVDNVYTFDNGNGNGWSSGTTAPWSIVWDGMDYAYDCDPLDYGATPVNLAGLATWSNYEIDLEMKIRSMLIWSNAYIYGRYTDANNHYVVDLERTDTGYRARLIKRVAGVNTVLGSYGFPSVPALETWANIRLSMNGGALAVKYNGATIISATDPTPIAAGKMGLAIKKQDVRFDNISTPVTTLLAEDLTDGVANGWTASPAASWTVVSDAGSNRYKFDFTWTDQTGSSIAGNANWTDYTVSTDFKVTDFQGWGLVKLFFRYVDADNNYSAQLQDNGGNRRISLIRRVNGVDTNLGSFGTTISLNTIYNLAIGGVGQNVVVKFNGDPVISVSDNGHAAGKVGLGAWKSDVLWDNIAVTQN